MAVNYTFTQIVKTVAATYTPEAIAVSGTYFRVATIMGKKAARTNNVDIVYIGIGSTNDTQPLAIYPGQIFSISMPSGGIGDLHEWYIDVETAGDGVVVIY